jgi:hypothetical protein
MFKISQRASDGASPSRSHPAVTVLETTARWLALHEDVGLGCECADPSLQIERWGQEIQSFPLTPSTSNLRSR